ncbi:DUF4126 family protein [Hymenobacter metallicola]|uniref:DUF4126 family protein n=1 Tax=Hymenobacter metallicola TaxID=2563114 RepID=A0A4Z0PZB2_9BACT|nr:DUF4126 family protein [Hymenobacter metallicola]TGE23130.1 DUF4126 family protein [Hymenobacter metallicola]
MATPLWQTLSLGTLAGLRSLTPLAFLSNSFSKHQSEALKASPFRLLQSGAAATGLKALAAGEMVADKVPGMPDRITPTALLGRSLSGALMGAMVYTSKRRSWLGGGLLGGLAAVAGTYGSFYLRQRLGKQTKLPDLLWALVEDATVFSSSKAASRLNQPAARRDAYVPRHLPAKPSYHPNYPSLF